MPDSRPESAVPKRRGAGRFGAALASSIAALALGVALGGRWHLALLITMIYALFIAVSAWYGGFAPGLACTLACTGSVTYFWLEPVGSFRVANLSELASVILFPLLGAGLSALSERGRASASW